MLIRNIKGISLLLFVLIVAVSCSKPELSPKDYYDWVMNEENGLLKEKIIPPIKVEVHYQPSEFVVVNHMRQTEIKKADFEKELERYKELQYFNLKLSVDGEEEDIVTYSATNSEERDKLNNYLAHSMEKDLKLVEGGDTLSPVLYHYEKSYDLKKERTFIIAFEKHKDSEQLEKTFVLDTPIWTTGPIKLVFERKDLLKVPTITLQS